MSLVYLRPLNTNWAVDSNSPFTLYAPFKFSVGSFTNSIFSRRHYKGVLRFEHYITDCFKAYITKIRRIRYFNLITKKIIV